MQNLKLGRLKGAWECAVAMHSAETWAALGVAALELLDVDMAIAGGAAGLCFLACACLALLTPSNWQDASGCSVAGPNLFLRASGAQTADF